MGGSVGFPLGERLAVADDELQVSHARRAEVGIVDLGKLSVIEGVPDLAVRRGRGPEAVFVGLGPHGLLTRGPGSPGRTGGVPRTRPDRCADQDRYYENDQPEQQPRPREQTLDHALSLFRGTAQLSSVPYT